MIDKTIFRQYDIRGLVPTQLDFEKAKQIGYFLGIRLKKEINEDLYIVIGYDIRTHSKELFNGLVSGLNKASCNILDIGLVATGVNYFASYQEYKIDDKKIKPHASIMITGSHNDKKYNGFKITFKNEPFFDKELLGLYEEIVKNKDIQIEDNFKAIKIDAKSLYIDYMVKEFKHLKSLPNSFAIDCGNGVADTVITEIFDKLDLNYKAIYTKPNGEFPNHHPDPSKNENLLDLKALLIDSNLGFAFDGDADRIAVLTRNHDIKGDTLAYLFSKTMKNPVIIGEVTYSQNIFDEINTHGTTIMNKTGYSNLRLKLKEINADLAAEVSGHIFFNDRYYGFDDAIYASLRVLELVHLGFNLDKEVEKLPKVYTSSNIEIEVKDEEKFLIIDKLNKLITNPQRGFPIINDIICVDGIRIIFEYGWALIRASNTNPVIVTKYEASSHATALTYQNAVENLIKKVLNEINSTTNKN